MKNKKLIPLLFCLCVSTLSAKEFTLSKQTDLSILISGTLLAGFDFASEHFWNLKDTTYNQALVDIDLVPEIDKLFINHYSKTLDYSATATLALGFLTPAVLLPADKSEWFTIGTMYAETVLWAYGVKEFAKLVVTRARPYMYFDDAPQNYIDDGDWCNSFFSGHSTWAFACATFTSYTFCKYFPDSPWRYTVVFSSIGLACTTATLRILSGNHFYTDVLLGALAGGTIGFVIPWLHTITPKNDKVNVDVTPMGFNCLIKF